MAHHTPNQPAAITEESVLAHHFDDLEQQHEAANLGMWTFLITELLFFGGLFTGYIVYRSSYPAAFDEGSRHLDLWLGTLNTGLLLVSSLTMALAVHAAQVANRKHATMFLLATVLLGSVFLGIKGVEYAHKFEEGIVPGAAMDEHMSEQAWADGVDPRNVRLFFSFYYGMTGLHAAHMIIGLGVLLWLALQTWRGRKLGPGATPVEMTGLYWHFVDIVWIFLFPLFYLIAL